MPTLRDELLNIQRDVYRRNLRLIQESLGAEPRLEKYAAHYKKGLKSFEKISTKTELIRQVTSSDIVYHGDYHPLRQSQRCILSVVREAAKTRPLVLCLEMFHAEDQKWIDLFLARKIPAREFLKKIDYAKKWAYKWEHWYPLIQMCRTRQIAVHGINVNVADHGDSLKFRDQFAAKIIARLRIRLPEHLIYVVHGDYHIAPEHLPGEVQKLLAPLDMPARDLVIYQNSANLYWQLAREGREDVDVLQIRPDAFCIMNTTPPNKLQSYLNWLEFFEDAYYPVNSDWSELSEGSATTSIPGIIRTITRVLKLDVPEGSLNHLTIHYATNLNFMKRIQEDPNLQPSLGRIRRKLKKNEGFLLEYVSQKQNTYLIYLANSSLIMAAEEATHFINAVLRGALNQKLSIFDDFYRNTLTEMLGFFGSKLITEKRRIHTVHTLEKFMDEFKGQKTGKTLQQKLTMARLIVAHRKLEKKSASSKQFKKQFQNIYRSRGRNAPELSTQLGYMLGNKLYYAVKKSRISLKEIQDLFQHPLTGKEEAFHIYLDLNRRVRTPRHQRHGIW